MGQSIKDNLFSGLVADDHEDRPRRNKSHHETSHELASCRYLDVHSLVGFRLRHFPQRSTGRRSAFAADHWK
jgi:hypothetical protein